MPKDTSIKKVLVIGSGPIVIGQAAEFDYAGTQACRVLKQEGVETILVNSNPATIMTDNAMADAVYLEPLTTETIKRIILETQPDSLLAGLGGQTGLTIAMELDHEGFLKEHNVRLIGTNADAIDKAEDRQLFKDAMAKIGQPTIPSDTAHDIETCVAIANRIGYPVIVRPAFTLGGGGGGVAYNEEELREVGSVGLDYSPITQVLIEKYIFGWKEIEFEVMRDHKGTAITICSMENFDPVGIHTGDSIVVAPALTLADKEYQMLRSAALKIIEELGIEGGCNCQFALKPDSFEYAVIEVNPRVSRSSALASKATGYPIAKITAKIALGYTLDEIKNDVTGETFACFEPAVDYVVVKFPKWPFDKFHGASRKLGSQMKATGEVMSIAHTFEAALMKAVRGAEIKLDSLHSQDTTGRSLDERLASMDDLRLFTIFEALSQGVSVDHIHDITKIDKWFLQKLMNIMQTSEELHSWGNNHKQITDLPGELLKKAKVQGFSDFQIARAIGYEGDMEDGILYVRNHRKRAGILPVVKQIDTLAAEYPAQTNYLYLTYSGVANDVHYLGDHKSIVVLGSGAYRIGSSVEFDWCGVQALNTIRKEGWRSVMINYNPETVSTDYDMCDRLYFDELTFERVMDILELENPHGVIVSTGGQIPNNLALRLDAQNINILGTSAKSIDNAEDREKFSAMLDRIGVDQPRWRELTSMDDINEFVDEVGFPVLVRPSYVLSGAAMNVCSNQEELERFLKLAANVSKKHPVVVSQFIEHAKEVEMDAVAQNGEIVAYAISEHIEYAGVHSGDATIQFPPQKLYVETVRRIKRISRQIAKELNISGPFNIQYLAKDNDIKVIECNLRASRSFPFVSKVLKINFIELATKVMLGLPVEKPNKNLFELDYVGIKASQFSFNRLQKADPVLGVDMASTGEVGCIGTDTSCAVLKAMLSVGYRIPEKSVLLSTGNAKQKADTLEAARMLQKKGYKLYATGGSSHFLTENGVENTRVYWPSEEGKPQALDMLHRKEIDMVVNIPKNLTAGELDNGYKIRRAAIDLNVPLITNARLASAFINAFCTMTINDIAIKSWAEYK